MDTQEEEEVAMHNHNRYLCVKKLSLLEELPLTELRAMKCQCVNISSLNVVL